MKTHEFTKCPGCGAHLGLSLLVNEDGRVEEVRIQPLYHPENPTEYMPSPLVIDGTGIYCDDCGTRLKQAGDLMCWKVYEDRGSAKTVA